MERERIGILGGSFNPIHTGHLYVARGMLRYGVADHIVLMVSPANPFKDSATLLPDKTRLRLARLACEGEERITVSDLEFTLPKPSYTFQTLRRLSELHPDKDFILIIGADNWKLFDKWKNYQEILARYPIAVYPRSGYPVCAGQLPATVRLVPLPPYDLSATTIREMIHSGQNISGFVPDKVKDEIERLKLYR